MARFWERLYSYLDHFDGCKTHLYWEIGGGQVRSKAPFEFLKTAVRKDMQVRVLSPPPFYLAVHVVCSSDSDRHKIPAFFFGRGRPIATPQYS